MLISASQQRFFNEASHPTKSGVRLRPFILSDRISSLDRIFRECLHSEGRGSLDSNKEGGHVEDIIAMCVSSILVY